MKLNKTKRINYSKYENHINLIFIRNLIEYLILVKYKIMIKYIKYRID